MKNKSLLILTLALLSTSNSQFSTLFAQGTAFTYQGRLDDGANPANGAYDLRFMLYTADPGGSQVGPTRTNAATGVSSGLFTVTLDFGANIFTNTDRFLEIAARTNGGGSFTMLSPRQKLTPAPYAIFAENVGVGGLTAGTYGKAVTFNNAANSFSGSFSGNGASISNVNALTLGGVASSSFWRLDGNNVSASQFLGTTNNQALEIRVNNTRALRIEPSSAPSLVGGYFQNNANGFAAVVIAGGGTSGSINEALGNYAFVGAGHGAKAGTFSAVVDGGYNVAPGQFSFIGSGLANTNLANYSFIGSGTGNFLAPGVVNSFIGGGTLNSNLVDSAVIVGGFRNTASGAGAFVGGGANNVAANFNATISGGANNRADANAATIGGGSENQATGDHNTVAGGQGNVSSVAGLFSYGHATVGGGAGNISSGDYATVGGGIKNLAAAGAATVGGGSNNVIRADSTASFIGGGENNFIQITSMNATISGGEQNSIGTNAGAATVGGGSGNIIQDNAGSSTIGGGSNNLIQAASVGSVVNGGSWNVIQGNSVYNTVSGGDANTSSNYAATVGGGDGNFSIGAYATVSGGGQNRATGRSAFIGGGGGRDIFGFTHLNTASGDLSVVSGGWNNLAFGSGSVVVGGWKNTSSGDYATVGGGYANISSGVYATIGGGNCNASSGDYATVGGGYVNTNSGFAATVGGGYGNISSSFAATVGGGYLNISSGTGVTIGGGSGNLSSGDSSTVGGGYNNTSSGVYATVGGGNHNASSSNYATVCGGAINTSSGRYATVPGGYFNSAAGDFSLAAGTQAKANHQGSFVWADSQLADFASTANDQFSIRAAGGVRLNTDTSIFCGSQTRQMLNLWSTEYGIGVQAATEYFRSSSDFSWFKGGVHSDATHDPGTGGTEMMRLDAAGNLKTLTGTISSLSDRDAKERFEQVDRREVLDKVAVLPLSKWSYKSDQANRHIGPMAQDFYAAFAVGLDDKGICTVDADGVALAAIQGLNQKVEHDAVALRSELNRKEAEIQQLKQRLDALENFLVKQK